MNISTLANFDSYLKFNFLRNTIIYVFLRKLFLSMNFCHLKKSIPFSFFSSIAFLTIFLNILIGINFGSKYWMPHHESNSKLGIYPNAAVASESGDCAPIGRDILLRGGSAIDATIAVLVCVGVVNPESSGIGGGFHVLYYNREENAVYHIDAREVAPLRATEDMFGGNNSLAEFGGLAIAVPGSLAGYAEMHERFGKLPWEELFYPSIKLCREGVRVNHHLHTAIQQEDEKFNNKYPSVRRMLTNPYTGELYKEGEIRYCFELADTMETIALQGKRALYGPSELAEAFLADLKSAGSIIERMDMLTYAPKIREPVKVDLRDGMTLYSANLPSGGPLIAFIINIMNEYSDLNTDVPFSKEKTVKKLHEILEAFKFAYAYRQNLEDSESEETQKTLKKILSKDFAKRVRNLINDSKVIQFDPRVVINDDYGTSQSSLIAPNGDAVSATQTINLSFGSHVYSESTGIILNDEMSDFSLPNITSAYGVPPSKKNRIRPGARPLSSMSPTIVVDSNRNARLVVGASNGIRIPTNVAQVIIRNLWLQEDIKDAINGPRFHYQFLPDLVFAETNYDMELIEALESLGHKFAPLSDEIHANVVGIETSNDGYIYANSDYRSSGSASGF